MSLFSVFLIGIGLSMDACAVSFAKGICLKKQVKTYALKLGLAFGFFQAMMPLIGWWVGTYFESFITAVDHWIAFFLLGFIGVNMIRESKEAVQYSVLNLPPNERPLRLWVCQGCKFVDRYLGIKSDVDSIPAKDILLLAVATSIDALAVGISFAFLNVDIIPAVCLIGITTFIISCIAVFLGNKIGGKLGKYAEITGGVILILIGLKILIEHLFGL